MTYKLRQLTLRNKKIVDTSQLNWTSADLDSTLETLQVRSSSKHLLSCKSYKSKSLQDICRLESSDWKIVGFVQMWCFDWG